MKVVDQAELLEPVRDMLLERAAFLPLAKTDFLTALRRAQHRRDGRLTGSSHVGWPFATPGVQALGLGAERTEVIDALQLLLERESQISHKASVLEGCASRIRETVVLDGFQ